MTRCASTAIAFTRTSLNPSIERTCPGKPGYLIYRLTLSSSLPATQH
jgi:hypothetical protein